MESIVCNKVTVKPIWLVVPLPLETLAVRLICKAKIIPVDVKAVQIHPLWNSSVFGAVCLGQTGDLARPGLQTEAGLMLGGVCISVNEYGGFQK